MRIGIITFHLSINYGAVLQAYALQTHLQQLGHEVEIIDYGNFTFRYFQYIPTTIKTFESKLSNLYYAKSFAMFRRRHLRVSPITYKSREGLKIAPPNYDAYICGSDQIWNHIFINGRYGFESSYFLDFGLPEVRRIAYAASLSTTEIPGAIVSQMRECLLKFNAISVRDRGGMALLSRLGFPHTAWLPDPTFLLNPAAYERVLGKGPQRNEYAFAYNLHNQSAFAMCIKALAEVYDVAYSNPNSALSSWFISFQLRRVKCVRPSPEAWLGLMRFSKFVLTDSFHGTVFSIIFKRPFVAVLVEGKLSGGNDRIVSMLERLGLENRIIREYDPDKMKQIMASGIDWSIVDMNLAAWRVEASDFLLRSLSNADSLPTCV